MAAPKPATSRPARSVGRPRSAASERAILSATLRILQDEGYAGLTIERVAATAKVSKATIYRRWPTKEHLILAVFEQLPVPSLVKGRSLEEELTATFTQTGRLMQKSPLQAVLPRVAAECVGNPALAGALIRVNEERREPLRALLRGAIERGEVAPDTNLELAIDVIQGAIAIRSYFLLDELKPAWIRQLVQLVISGIGQRSRRKR